MLGWLRRRIWRKHIKLVHQNGIACGFMSDGTFYDEPAVATVLKDDERRCEQWYELLTQRVPLPSDAVSDMLQLNRRLRRLYDATASRHVESFEVATTPLLGWKEFFGTFVVDAE